MVRSFLLPNGLMTLFEERATAHVVSCQIWVRAGSADENLEQAGMAHLHEHMLFRGTSLRGPGEVAREIEAHGGQINAWTSYDQTVFHVEIASQFARLGLDVLADAIRNASFEPQQLEREVEVVCEEIKRNLDAPARRASRDLFATAFERHPYRLPVAGTVESVRGFRRENVLAFYSRHYTPRNLILCVAGDVREGELREWVEASLGGDWGAPWLGPIERPIEPEVTTRRILLRPDDVKLGSLSLGFHIPSITHPDTPALDLLAMLMGLGEGSRLVRELKRRRGLVNTVQSASYTPRDPGLFSVTLTTQPERMVEALAAEVQVLASLCTSTVTEEELSKLKFLFESRSVYQLETVQGLARRVGYYQTMFGDIDAATQYQDAVAAITKEDLSEAASRYLRFDRAVVTGLLPPGSTLTKEGVNEILDRAEEHSPPQRERSTARASMPRARASASPVVSLGGVVSERLDSGVRVVVCEDHSVPLVAQCLLAPGGLRYESVFQNGISTLTSRCFTRGTPTHDTNAITGIAESFAGSIRGVSGRNTMGLRSVALASYVETSLRLLADCAEHPLFPEAEVARERRMLAEEIHARQDKPSALVFDLFAATLFETHPYRMPSLGEAASVQRLSAEDLREFHSHRMNRSQFVLSVVGDVKADHVFGLARDLFGSYQEPRAPDLVVEREASPERPRRAHLERRTTQTHLMLGFQGARVNDPWRSALAVLSMVLGGQGGRLFRELRDRQGLAYSVSSINLEGVDPGYFGVYMATSPEKVDIALRGIREQLRGVRDQRLPEVELDRARQFLVGAHEIAQQRNAARADTLAMDACFGVGLENFEHFSERVAAVTAEDVRSVAERIIDFERSALAIVGPAMPEAAVLER